MPPYHIPHLRVVVSTVTERCWDFLKRAGTIIFAFSVVSWAATHYPKPAHYSQDYATQIATLDSQIAPLKEKAEAYGNVPKPTGVLGDANPLLPEYVTQYKNLTQQRNSLQDARSREILESSAAGRAGKFIAPAFYPLGFDWKTSVGITGAFFAREIIVSTLGICYASGDTQNSTAALQAAMKADTWPPGTPRAGTPIWTPLTALTLMVFVVFCMQCLSTLTIVKKETRHWGWPLFMFAYMTTLAYLAAFLTFQIGSLLGLHR
jgi:ferrous iron transport protein B